MLSLVGLLATSDVASADLLISSFLGHRVARFDEMTGAAAGDLVEPGSGGLSFAAGIAFGPDGNFYVGSMETDSVLRFDGRTGSFLDVFVAPGSGGLDGTQGIVFAGDHLYVISRISNSLLRFDATTGDYDATFSAGGGALDDPYAVVASRDGEILVSSRNSASVARFDSSTGEYIGDLVPSGSGGLDNALDVAIGPDNHLYVASADTHSVLRFDGSTGAFIDVFASGNGLFGPAGLAFGPDGLLYVSSAGTDRVFRFDGTTGEFVDVFVESGAPGVSWPTFLAFTPDSTFRAGNVNAAVGPTANVLLVNGSPGAGAARRVGLSPEDPLEVYLDRPPSRPSGPVAYALYAWVGSPSLATARVLPFGLGWSCMPTPLTGDGPPSPKAIWNTIGLQGALGIPNRTASKAPASLLRLPRGTSRPGTFFLQGFILDPNAPNGSAAVTNGVEIVVE